MIGEMATYGIEFVDQPVLMYDKLRAVKHVRDDVSVPIAAHESGWTMYHLLNVVKSQAADIVHIDPRFDAGLTGTCVSRPGSLKPPACRLSPIPTVSWGWPLPPTCI